MERLAQGASLERAILNLRARGGEEHMGGNGHQVWDRMEVLFGEALSMAPERRTAFLDEVCADDPALRTELESLLSSYDEASEYFDSLAADVLPSLLQDLDPSLASQSFSSRIGQDTGAYRIVEKLGNGGMGVVYKAYDTRLDRSVALKFLPPHLSAHPAAEQRFIREAKAASALDHPNICTIYEADATDDGQRYIAMAYYAGETLKAKITRGPLPVEEAVDYALQIADGLSCAHGAGITHRDIKPANVLITKAGVAKIVDFGLARGPESSLTKTGATMGTVAYMSPEQARGETIDARTDLWALGVVLYEMLTGERPFRAGNEHATLYAIQHEQPAPLSDFRSDVPYALQEAVMSCLEKDPEARPPRADTLQVNLSRARRAASEKRIHAGRAGRNTPPLSSRARPWTVGVLIALLFGLSAWWLTASHPESLSGSEAIPAEKHLVVLPFTNVGGDAANQAFSDGLMETLTNKLTQLERLQGALLVVPATEIRADGIASARAARETYGVNLAVTGSVQRTGDSVYVTLNLVDTRTLLQLRSDEVTEPTSDMATLQYSAVSKLMQMLNVELQPEAREFLAEGETTMPDAYDFYLQGRGYLQRYENPENIDTAIGMFERALAEDSLYALAYAGLGEAYWHKYTTTSDAQWVARAVEYCQRAVAINDQLAPVHVTLGIIHRGTGEYEQAVEKLRQAVALDAHNANAYRELGHAYEMLGLANKAESAYQRAIQLRPSYWGGYSYLGVFYYNQGRYEEAAAQFRQITQLSPDNVRGYSNLGGAYLHLERWTDAREAFERSLEVEPNFDAYSNLGTLYHFYEADFTDAAQMYEKALELDDRDYQIWGNLASARYWAGDHEKARHAYQRAIRMAQAKRDVNPRDSEVLCDLAMYHAMLGEQTRARAPLERAKALVTDVDVMFSIGIVYEQLGEREQALEWISKALENGYSPGLALRSPTLQELREDERFERLNSQEQPI
jgi:serine/threonine-protein kinase